MLAAYVDGNDLQDVAKAIRSRLESFLADREWPTDRAVVVDQVHAPDPDFPDFLPDWDLGINIGLDHVTQSDDWFRDIEQLVRLLKDLHGETAKDFVMFVCFRSRPWLQEQLCHVDGTAVDLPWLQGAIERRVASSVQ